MYKIYKLKLYKKKQPRYLFGGIASPSGPIRQQKTIEGIFVAVVLLYLIMKNVVRPYVEIKNSEEIPNILMYLSITPMKIGIPKVILSHQRVPSCHIFLNFQSNFLHTPI